MITLKNILDDLNINYTIDNNFYRLEDSNKILKYRSVSERNYYYKNNKNYYKNEHYHFKSIGTQLIYIDDTMLDTPLLENFTIPFIKFISNKFNTRILYGRNVECIEAKKENDKKVLREFVDKYHLQKNVRAKYYYGFYFKDKLIGVMSFGKNLNPKYKNNKKLIELKRMVWLPDYQIRYGLSKGIITFLKSHKNYNSILSYSLNDISNGISYEKAGFTYIGKSVSGVSYINPNNPCDCYSSQINTPWGFSTGVVAKNVVSLQETTFDFREYIIENRLPHRVDDGFGYIPCVNSGNDVWIYYKNKY